MRSRDERINDILLWWRKQPLWNKCLFAVCHTREWFAVVCLDRADRNAAQDMLNNIFKN